MLSRSPQALTYKPLAASCMSAFDRSDWDDTHLQLKAWIASWLCSPNTRYSCKNNRLKTQFGTRHSFRQQGSSDHYSAEFQAKYYQVFITFVMK
jgi:hypothetical protein